MDGSKDFVVAEPSSRRLFGCYAISSLGSSPPLICVVSTSGPTTTQYYLSLYSLSQSDSKMISQISLDFTSPLTGFDVLTTSNGCLLVSCASADHKWHLHKWRYLSNLHELLFVRALRGFSPRTAVSCSFGDEHCVVFAGMSSISSNATVAVWETCFGTMQGQTSFDEASVLQGTIDLSLDQVSKSIFLSLERSVVTCKLACPPPTLANVLGSCADTPNANALSCIIQFQALSSVSPLSEWALEIQAKDAVEKGILQRLFPERPLSSKLFCQIFAEYVSGRTKSSAIKRKTPDSTDDSSVAIIFPHAVVRQVANHCITRNDLWEPLQTLVETNSLSVSTCPLLISHIISHRQFKLLSLALDRLQDIPESDLVVVSHFALSQDHIDSKYLDVMNRVLCVPHNKTLLREALRSLPSSHIPILMKFLANSLQEQIATDAVPSARQPTVSQTLDWCSALLDVHFMSLVLLVQTEKKSDRQTSVEADLRLISQLAQSQVAIRENMKTLKGVINHSIQQCKNPQQNGFKKARLNQPAADYTIQILTL